MIEEQMPDVGAWVGAEEGGGVAGRVGGGGGGGGGGGDGEDPPPRSIRPWGESIADATEMRRRV